jgi:light-harvesting complex II chlorophyll a/b binding protein 4
MSFKLPQLPNFGSGTAKKPATISTKPAAKPVAAKPATTVTKKVASSSGTRSGGVGYRKYQGDALWLPNTQVRLAELQLWPSGLLRCNERGVSA